MQIGNKLFPYPTINNIESRSCYKETTYAFKCNDYNDGKSYILEDAYIEINNSKIKKLMEEGTLGAALIVECSSTIYRKMYEITTEPQTIKIDINNLRDKIKKQNIKEAEEVKQALREEIQEIFDSIDSSLHLETTPSVILVVGVNGVGKTTSIGKIANRLKQDGKKVIIAAADTFRAAAVEQLEIWADRAGCQIVKKDEGADPASVVYDAIDIAKKENADVLICDTAGRLHNKKYLMDELEKIKRVINKELPEASKEVLLVIDATTGQNAILQVQAFKETVDITGLILTKLDGTAKGGVVIGITNENQMPVKFIGVGEQIDDMEVFNSKDFVDAII